MDDDYHEVKMWVYFSTIIDYDKNEGLNRILKKDERDSEKRMTMKRNMRMKMRTEMKMMMKTRIKLVMRIVSG